VVENVIHFSLLTERSYLVVMRKKIEGKKECRNGIACRYFSREIYKFCSKTFLYSVSK
jgi:hypothetical protein